MILAVWALILASPTGPKDPLPGPALQRASAAYVQRGEIAARRHLEQLAKSPAPAKERSWALFAAGVGDYRRKDFASAANAFERAAANCGDLCDYVQYHRALTASAAMDPTAAARLLRGFAERFPHSRLRADALRVRVASLLRTGEPREALAELSKDSLLPAPERLLLSARAASAAGDQAAANGCYAEIVVEYPLAAQGAEAQKALEANSRRLTGAELSRRAEHLFGARRYSDARAEYSRITSVESDRARREQASVRIPACDFRLDKTEKACGDFARLQPKTTEAAAERLYWLVECARRTGDAGALEQRVEELRRRHSSSQWYERALVSAGNLYLLQHAPESARHFQTLATTFPSGPAAAHAHWKAAWRAYLDRAPDAARLLQEHAEKYPDSPQAPAALYWLASAVGNSDARRAQALYQRVRDGWPNQYYGLRAAEQLSHSAPAARRARPAVAAKEKALQPPAAVATVIRRSRILRALALTEQADAELKAADRNQPGAFWIGMELAELAKTPSELHSGLRWLKHFSPGYLAQSYESMPRRFWELMFPLPFREAMLREARRHDIDPHLLAALIRQESEFNPAAKSVAGARGLMQVMPATANLLAKQVGRKSRISTADLHLPDLNLQLGSRYLRGLLDRFETPAVALAGYNAGPTRAVRWSAWVNNEEFIETIPFTETREYVLAVLRNTEIYRGLYDLPASSRVSRR